MRLTAADLVRAINGLPRNQRYTYVNPANKGRIIIHRITEPEGPIEIKRFNLAKDSSITAENATIETISTQMLWRLANAIIEGRPLNVDRIFGGSYNTRSVLEALVAHTPEFYYCYPGRVEDINGQTQTKSGHKHLIYLPNEPHDNAKLVQKNVNMVISELATNEAVYAGLEVGTAIVPTEKNTGMSEENIRRHAQMQYALLRIGQQIGFRTYIAANDQHIQVQGKPIREMEGVVQSLASERILSAYPEAHSAGKLIDVIWFRNGRLMPAVIEVEHSTGVRSGLDRMLKFHNEGPLLANIRWTIVAPDEDRSKVIDICQEQQYRPLSPKFFPYSAVEELYSLIQRRKPKASSITDEFLDAFMEDTLVA